jgi:hypothetical protein
MIKTIAAPPGQECQHIEMTADEIAARQAEEAAVAAAAPRRDLLAQIANLEAQQTPRRIREALKDPTFMNALDAQVSALRAKL